MRLSLTIIAAAMLAACGSDRGSAPTQSATTATTVQASGAAADPASTPAQMQGTPAPGADAGAPTPATTAPGSGAVMGNETGSGTLQPRSDEPDIGGEAASANSGTTGTDGPVQNGPPTP